MFWKKDKGVVKNSAQEEADCDATSIGNLLLTAEVITREQLNEALKLQEEKKDLQLGKILVELGYINNEILEYFFENQTALRTFKKREIQKVVKFAIRRNKDVNIASDDLRAAVMRLTTKLDKVS